MRLYISPIVERANPRHASRRVNPVTVHALATEKAGVTRCQAVISSVMVGADRGKPRLPWAIVGVEATDWSAIEADASIGLLLLDENLDQVVPNNIKTRARNFGVITQSEANGVSTYRELINLVIGKHYPGVTIEQQFPALA